MLKLNELLKNNDSDYIARYINKINNEIELYPEPCDYKISTISLACKINYILKLNKIVPLIREIVENKKSELILDIKIGKDYLVNKKKIKRHKKGEEIKKKNNRKDNNDDFYNQTTLVIFYNKNINVKLFDNGSVSMTGCKDENDGINLLNCLFLELKRHCDMNEYLIHREHDGIIDINNIIVYESKMTMINSGFSCNFKIDRIKLFKIILNNYKVYTSYNPDSYQGVKIGYMYNENKDGICHCDKKCSYERTSRKKNECKLVTIVVFQSGEIIITGSNKIEQTYESYKFINKILKENYNKIVRFSILEIE